MKYTFILIFLLFLLPSCKDEPITPKPEAKLMLSVEDVSCTEAWLNLKLENVSLPINLELKSDTSILKTFTSINSNDTVLYVDSLLPNQTYSLQVSSIQNPATSNEVGVATMDTTSHNFTWQQFEFGTIGSSVFYDVAIIDENNIWAVGEIMIADTSANGYTIYNAVHWNGSEWKLYKFQFYTFCGQTHTGSYPAKSIFAFNENEIFISSGSQITQINGINQIKTDCIPISVNKLWGTDKNNLYAVGFNGQIAHYNGSQWRRIESGTTLNINDIWGNYNNKTGEWEILAVASNILQSFDKEVLRINNSIEKLNKDGIEWTLSSLWFRTNKKYYVIGSGIYKKNSLSEIRWQADSDNRITNYHVNRIRANESNDLYVGGAYGEVLHFNGFTWKSFIAETGLQSGAYLSLSSQNDFVIFVGYNSPRAIITIGKRTN